MYKLLIADDEPLAQVGIKSMLNWTDFEIDEPLLASNGEIALQMLRDQRPDIVITDIKMPKLSGLELAKISKEEFGKLPVFIILTNFEDFHLARESLSYEVVDYLVKLELDTDSLQSAVNTAIKRVKEQKSFTPAERNQNSILQFRDKFFIRLLNNLFESEEQMLLQSRELNIDLSATAYTVAYCTLKQDEHTELSHENFIYRYTSTLEMTRELLPKFVKCHLLSLDMSHFACIFLFSENQIGMEQKLLENAITSTFTTLEKYYNARLSASVGPMVDKISLISTSYDGARKGSREMVSNQRVLFWDNHRHSIGSSDFFNLEQVKSVLSSAYEEYDGVRLKLVMDEIIHTIKSSPEHFVDALDLAGNILYMTISLLQNGEAILSDIFRNHTDGYRSLYSKTTPNQISSWLTELTQGLTQLFEEKKRDYKHHIVHNVKHYITDNVHQKLTLNEVAAVFGISPNYLSSLFKKNADMGFTEFVNYSKVQKAKELMDTKNLKIYEISHDLGFESAFYFSKVFKKVEGYSPSEYHVKRMK